MDNKFRRRIVEVQRSEKRPVLKEEITKILTDELTQKSDVNKVTNQTVNKYLCLAQTIWFLLLPAPSLPPPPEEELVPLSLSPPSLSTLEEEVEFPSYEEQMEPEEPPDRQIEHPLPVHETVVSTRCPQVFLPTATVYETDILNAKALDLSQPSPKSRDGLRVIQLHDKKNKQEQTREC